MEVVPIAHFTRLCTDLAQLAELIANAPAAAEGERELHTASLLRVKRDVQALGGAGGVKAASTDYVDSATRYSGNGSKEPPRPPSGDGAGVADTGATAVYLRAEDLRPDLDLLKHRFLEARADIDYLKSSVHQHNHTLTTQSTEVQQLRSAVRSCECDQQTSWSARQAAKEQTLRAESATDAAHRAVDGFQDFMNRVRTEFNSESSSIHKSIHEAKAHTDSKAAELQGFIRAVDKEQEDQFKAVQAWETKAELRFAELVSSIEKTGADASSEVRKHRNIVEEQMASHKLESDTQIHKLKEAILTLEKSLSTSLARCVSDLTRCDKDLGQRVDSLERGAERQQNELRRQSDSLGEELGAVNSKLEQTSVLLVSCTAELHTSVAQARGELQAQMDELVSHKDQGFAKLEAGLSEVWQQAETNKGEVQKEIRQAVVQAAERSNQNEQRIQHTNERLELATAEVKAYSDTAVDAVTQRLEQMIQQFQELREDEHALAESCRELAMHTGSEFERQRADFGEQVRAVRSETLKGLSNVQAALADTRAELQQALQRMLKQQHAQHTSECAALRRDVDAVVEEVGMQARRAAQLEERSAAQLQSTRDNVESMTAEQNRVVCELGDEMRTAVAQMETRLRLRLDGEAVRVERLERAARATDKDIEALRTEGAARQLQEEWLAKAAAANCIVPAPAVVARPPSTEPNGPARNQPNAKPQQPPFRATTPPPGRVTSVTAAREQQAPPNRASEQDSRASHLALAEVRTATDSLSASLVSIARCCGLLEGIQEVPLISRVGLRQLLQWERAGFSLSARLEERWLGRTLLRAQLIDDGQNPGQMSAETSDLCNSRSAQHNMWNAQMEEFGSKGVTVIDDKINAVEGKQTATTSATLAAQPVTEKQILETAATTEPLPPEFGSKGVTVIDDKINAVEEFGSKGVTVIGDRINTAEDSYIFDDLDDDMVIEEDAPDEASARDWALAQQGRLVAAVATSQAAVRSSMSTPGDEAAPGCRSASSPVPRAPDAPRPGVPARRTQPPSQTPEPAPPNPEAPRGHMRDPQRPMTPTSPGHGSTASRTPDPQRAGTPLQTLVDELNLLQPSL